MFASLRERYTHSRKLIVRCGIAVLASVGLVAQSGPLASKPAPANIVTPGFAGRFYYLGSQGQLWELHPVHVTH